MERAKDMYITYILYASFGIQRKPCLRFMNRLDSFEQVQHFDAYN